MIVKNRRKVAFYTHVAASTPQHRSSRCRICQFRVILRENIGDASSTTSQMDKLFENLPKVVKFMRNFVTKICCITNKTKKKMVAWIYLNHMSFCLKCLHFRSDVDCICDYSLFKWVITRVSVETRLLSILYLFSNRALLLTCSSRGVTPKYSTNGSGPKKSEQAGPHHSTGRIVVSLCRPLLHYEKRVSCLIAPY